MKGIDENMQIKEYYVYEHYLDDKLFYIGYGTARRAYSFTQRRPRWKKIVGSRYDDVKVKIVAYFDTREEARKLETELIKKNDMAGVDLANIAHTKNPPSKLKEPPKLNQSTMQANIEVEDVFITENEFITIAKLKKST